MIHRYHGGKKAVRLALKRSLLRGLVLQDRIETTLARAKETASFAEEVVKVAKANSLAARRRVLAQVGDDKKVLEQIFSKVLPRLSNRTSGYTRVVRLGERRGDGTMMARVEWVAEKKI